MNMKIIIKSKNLIIVVALTVSFSIISGVFLLVLPPMGEDEADETSDELPLHLFTEISTKTYEQLEREGLLDQMNIIDDRIAPYENQALVLEVNRIRHRGLLDRLLSWGSSWKQTPEFYYVSNMDGMEYVSKDISQHVQSSEVLFTDWDTIFQENKVVRTAVQEQKTSQVTLTIVEREKTGVLGLRQNDVEKDTFTVTYCYRTGRWTGDDSFRDTDGYGYYLGDTFEIWFNLYQMDYDNDQLPYWMEVNVLNTDPTVADSSVDADDDSVPLFW